jgi:hypothetical protein
MSKHVGRKDRWTRVDAKTYASDSGKVIYDRGAWYAVFDYRTIVPAERPEGLPGWQWHTGKLGPFKRPRNAMVALEQELTFLKNHHGEGILFGEAPDAQSLLRP